MALFSSCARNLQTPFQRVGIRRLFRRVLLTLQLCISLHFYHCLYRSECGANGSTTCRTQKLVMEAETEANASLCIIYICSHKVNGGMRQTCILPPSLWEEMWILHSDQVYLPLYQEHCSSHHDRGGQAVVQPEVGPIYYG
jgi:hypothetical protein